MTPAPEVSPKAQTLRSPLLVSALLLAALHGYDLASHGRIDYGMNLFVGFVVGIANLDRRDWPAFGAFLAVLLTGTLISLIRPYGPQASIAFALTTAAVALLLPKPAKTGNTRASTRTCPEERSPTMTR